QTPLDLRSFLIDYTSKDSEELVPVKRCVGRGALPAALLLVFLGCGRQRARGSIDRGARSPATCPRPRCRWTPAPGYFFPRLEEGPPARKTLAFKIFKTRSGKARTPEARSVSSRGWAGSSSPERGATLTLAFTSSRRSAPTAWSQGSPEAPK